MRAAFALRIDSGRMIVNLQFWKICGFSRIAFSREGSWREAAFAAPLSTKARRCGRALAPPRGPTSPGRGKMSPQVTKGGIWHRVAMTERVLPLQKRNTGTPAGVPVPRSLNKENQIRLRASSSPTRMKAGCSCRMLAGTSGVTGPKKAFLTISALPAPLTTISTLRACMMVRMPMV